MEPESSRESSGGPVRVPAAPPDGGGRGVEAARFRGVRNAVMAGVIVTAVVVAVDGWRERGWAGVLLGVLAAVIAVPLVLGALWLILRPGGEGSNGRA